MSHLAILFEDARDVFGCVPLIAVAHKNSLNQTTRYAHGRGMETQDCKQSNIEVRDIREETGCKHEKKHDSCPPPQYTRVKMSNHRICKGFCSWLKYEYLPIKRAQGQHAAHSLHHGHTQFSMHRTGHRTRHRTCRWICIGVKRAARARAALEAGVSVTCTTTAAIEQPLQSDVHNLL